MTQNTYLRPDIQGLRAVAVLMVLAYHAGLPVSGGFTGVDVFFVISGFVITKLLLRESDLSVSKITILKTFYTRRVKRLAPALGLMIGTVVITSWALESSWGEQARTAKNAIASLAIFANIHLAFSARGYFELDSKTNPLLHTWSLSLEEQFYLIFPLILLFLLRHRDIRSSVRILGMLFLLSLAASVFHSYGIWPLSNWARASEISFYSPWTRSWEFLAGTLLAVIPQSSLVNPGKKLYSWMTFLGLVLLAISMIVLQETSTFPGVAAILPVLGASLTIRGWNPSEPSFVHRALSAKWMQWIGDRSYSIYLWHWPCVVFGQRQFADVDNIRLIATLLSIIPASLSYSLIELPWRRVPQFTKKNFVLLALTSFMLPAALAVVLKESDQTNSLKQVTSSESLIESENLKSCWGFDEVCLSGNTVPNEILLIGDSHAGSLVFLLDDVSRALGLVPSVATKPGCPIARDSVAFYLYEISDVNLMTKDNCADIFDQAVEWSNEHRPRIILLAMNAPLYAGSQALSQSFDLRVACFLGKDNNCIRSKSPRDRITQLETILANSLEELSRSTDHLILVAPLPVQYRDPEMFMAVEGLRGTPRIAVNEVREPILALYSKLRSRFPTLQIWDPIDQLCTPTICIDSDDTGPLYSDNTHLSVHGASRLKASLETFLMSLNP